MPIIWSQKVDPAERERLQKLYDGTTKERKKSVSIGFNKKSQYGMTFFPDVLVSVLLADGSREFGTYADRQEAIYNYVMKEQK